MIGEKFSLKLSLVKGVTRFKKKDKLNPGFIYPLEVLLHFGEMNYEVDMPPLITFLSNFECFDVQELLC